MADAKDHEAECGLALVFLLYQQRSWILRRTERVTFDDARTVRRRSELDMSLTRFGHKANTMLPQRGDRALLPIMMVSRRHHYDITVARSSGEPLPFLPRREERELVAAGLAELSILLDQEAGRPARYGTWNQRYEAIHSVIDRSPEADLMPVDPLVGSIETFLETFVENHVIIATPPHAELLSGLEPTGLVKLVETHAEALDSAETYRRGSGGRGGLEKAFARIDEEYDQESTGHALARAGHRRDRPDGWVPLWRQQGRRDDLNVAFRVGQTVDIESIHLELVCPAGVYVDDAVLVAAVVLDNPDQSVEIVEVLQDDVHWDAAHAYYSTSLHAEPVDSAVDGRFLAVLRPSYHGLMHAGQNVAVLAAIVLWLLTFTLGWRAAGWDPVVGMPLSDQNTTEAVVAMLLLAPSAALVLLIRHDEHLLAKKVAMSYRTRLGKISACTFGAATALAVGVTGWQLFSTLLLFAIVATRYAAITAVVAQDSRRGPQGEQPSLPWVDRLSRWIP